MLQWINKYQTRIFKAAFLLAVLLGAAFLFTNDLVLAQSVADPNSSINQGVKIIEQPLGLPTTDIRTIIANIIKIALGLVGLVMVVLFMYAGYLWMTAGGNDEQITKAKALIKNAVIGLAIILSAYSIVLFALKMLGIGDSGNNNGIITGQVQEVGNFRGSGALGQVVRDHYPMRNQTGVARNAKIVVTFRKPISLENFVEDRAGKVITNAQNELESAPDGILGNCNPNMTSWVNDCDRIKIESVDNVGSVLVDKFISIKRTDSGTVVPAAAIMAVTSTDPTTKIAGIYTITIKPLPVLTELNGGVLGSDEDLVNYTVHLGNELELDTADSPRLKVFNKDGIGNDYYEWAYTYDTKIDTAPPHVVSVFPNRDKSEARNSVIQIDFSEAMDPTLIQGKFVDSKSNSTFVLDGNSIYLKNSIGAVPEGTFNLVNGYRTLEFTPSTVCGENACGGKVYCLPADDSYQILLKAAKTISDTSFEARPYTGITDNSGNALDGDNDSKIANATDGMPVFDNWKQPNNDFWKFSIKNEIDISSPYLTKIKPGIDATFIEANSPWEMTFNKRMRVEPMYTIKIDEKPPQKIPLWLAPRVIFGETNTLARMLHGSFIDSIKQDYFPVLSSDLQDVHFNCFFPGKGPMKKADSIDGELKTSVCTDDNNCCGVNSLSPFCCNGVAGTETTSTCKGSIK